jgi:hypothetical protein
MAPLQLCEYAEGLFFDEILPIFMFRGFGIQCCVVAEICEPS